MQISIKTVEGKTINLDVNDSSDTIDLKVLGPTRELIIRLGPDTDTGPEAVIPVFISSIGGKLVVLEVERNETVENVMAKIHEKGGPQVDKQMLIFQGKQLDKGRTLADYRINKESTIVLITESRICGF